LMHVVADTQEKQLVKQDWHLSPST
jgi:hypothetical protein